MDPPRSDGSRAARTASASPLRRRGSCDRGLAPAHIARCRPAGAPTAIASVRASGAPAPRRRPEAGSRMRPRMPAATMARVTGRSGPPRPARPGRPRSVTVARAAPRPGPPASGREGGPPCQHLVGYRAEGEEVARRGGRLAAELLGGDVAQRPDQHPRARRRGLVAVTMGDAEVRQAGPAVAVEKDVAGADVAMDEPSSWAASRAAATSEAIATASAASNLPPDRRRPPRTGRGRYSR